MPHPRLKVNQGFHLTRLKNAKQSKGIKIF